MNEPFKITGLGEYRTRDGHKAVIDSKFDPRRRGGYVWEGSVDGVFESWTVEGQSRISKGGLPQDIVAKWEEPFRITGPGEYRVENLEKAIVLGRNPNAERFQWIGYLGNSAMAWSRDGRCVYEEHPFDIIGPWVEPFTREVWVNVYPSICAGHRLRFTALRDAVPDCIHTVGIRITEGKDAEIIETIHHGGGK